MKSVDPPIDARGLKLGFCTALVPSRGRTVFVGYAVDAVMADRGHQG
jgi:hypothetical protein